MNRFPVSVLLATCCLAVSASAQQKGLTVDQPPAEVLEKAAGVGERYALLIGISRYANPAINLSFAAADAESMRKLLLDPEVGGYKPENVRLLVNDQATRKAIVNAMGSWLTGHVKPADSVLIFYSGHGALGTNTDAYWVSYDADIEDLRSSALSNREISDLIAALPANRKLTLIDSCFSEATAKKFKALVPEDVFRDFDGGGAVTMTASTGQEKSVELNGHGAFTYHLLDALQGKADANANGVVELDEVWSYLSDRVQKTAAEGGNRQRPVLLADRMEHGFPLTINPAFAGGATLAEVKKLYSSGTITVDEMGEAERLFERREGTPEIRKLYRDLVAGVLTPEYFRQMRQLMAAQAPAAPAPSAAPRSVEPEPVAKAPAEPAPIEVSKTNEASAYVLAESQNSEQAWENFVRQYPTSQLAIVAQNRLEALRAGGLERETALYAKAVASNTAEDWNQLLKEFPAGRFVEEAVRKKIEAEAYVLAESQNSEQGWESFATQYPTSPLAAVAQGKVEALRKKETALYEKAVASNMADDWSRLLKEFPTGPHAEEAGRKKIEAEAYAVAVSQNTQQGWEGFLSQYQTSPLAGVAQKRLEALQKRETALYEKATGSNTVEDWDHLLKEFPSGRYAEEAATKKEEAERRLIEEQTFETARTADTIDSWKVYLDKYPNGSGASEATKRVEQLTWLKDADLVAVPAGSFMMGSRKGNDDAKPEHIVELDAFRMGRGEVTNSLYLKFVEATKRPRPKDPNFATNYIVANPGLPVVNVRYADALAFCKWLSEKTGRIVRLPTEAEWEYAARGGQPGHLYPWGDGDPHTHARFNDNAKSGPKTVPPDAFPPNDFGIRNLAGNVAEWVADYYDDQAYIGVTKNPMGPRTGSERVVRGGSFDSGDEAMRVFQREKADPNDTKQWLGFRIVVQ